LVAAAELGQSLWKIAQGLDTSRVTAAILPRPSEKIANVVILRLLQSHAPVMKVTKPVAAEKELVH
jgi:hypothetical protein